MILRELGLYSDPPQPPDGHRPLHVQTRCVCALVERFLPPLVTEKEWKISVHVSPSCAKAPMLTVSGVATVTIVRDVSAFFDMDDSAKKEFAIKALQEGAVFAAKHYGWPTDQISAAISEAKRLGLVNEWKFQPKWNPSRKLKASVVCRHETDKFCAELQVEDRQGALVGQQRLFEDIPSEFCFAPRLGNIKWNSTSSVCLYDRSGHIVGEPMEIDS